MIDLHCHLLPGLDDGAADMETSLAMARMAVADGIRVTACTPHILPGLYHNEGDAIRAAVDALSAVLAEEGIPLTLVSGADIHIARDLGAGLRSGKLPTLNGSRYFLLEPPHHVEPPGFEDCVFSVQAAGFVPIITHPERLSWFDSHYATFARLARSGVWMQLTAGSLAGQFGRRAEGRAWRLLDDGLAHIVASDAHETEKRRPVMSAVRAMLSERYGEAEATDLFVTRPQCVLDDASPDSAPEPYQVEQPHARRPESFIQRLFSRA